MGCYNGKQHDHKGNNKRQPTIKKILSFSSSRKSNRPRPVSYAGINQCHHEEHSISIRPSSMFDDSKRKISTYDFDDQSPQTSDINRLSQFSARPSLETDESILTARSLNNTTMAISREKKIQKDFELLNIDKSTRVLIETNEIHMKIIDDNNWKYFIPLTLEKIRITPKLQDQIYQYANYEICHVLNRLLRFEKSDENEEFLEWFFDEVEYLMHSFDYNNQYEHKSLLLSSIEQDRYDCMKYLLDHQLLPSKLDINTMNDQGRHCLLMLAHRNGPIDSVKYLLTRHLACLDTNKLDLNKYSSLHHACRHFNLFLSELLLPYTNRKILRMENSELHTPLDYWLECLCSLKKLKPTNIQHHSDSLRLDCLLNDSDYYSNVVFFQSMINHGGQLTKIPLRYIRSVLPQLTFEQKLSYVDHHVNLCCTLYKNRLSTLLLDYDNLKISIQAGELLTEFIYALGTIQLEVQSRLAAHAYSSVYETAIQRIYREDSQDNSNNRFNIKDHNSLQLTMRILYFKFFRLFQCIYNNPDVTVKNFHFENIFRRVWIYWKEPVKAFITQCRQKNSSLKSICRKTLFKHLIHYPADVQKLPINPSLKRFVTYDNQFFIVQKHY